MLTDRNINSDLKSKLKKIGFYLITEEYFSIIYSNIFNINNSHHVLA